PPRAGDQPQIWVEVDLTKPQVRLVGGDVGRGPDLGTMTITWSAAGKNLAKRPIKLSWAEAGAGPGQSNVEDEENTGRYVWKIPESVPYRVLVRVEAADLAGNVASAELTKHAIVETAQPKVKSIKIRDGK